MNFLIAVAAMGFVLGVLIVVHEFGHYAVAKLCGVRVEVFSVGFGKRLFGFRRGDTDYRISALPFGGYVKMAGENPMDSHTEDPGEFMNHPRWQRFLIALAGPTMNIVLAVAVLTGVYMVRFEHWVIWDKPVDVSYVDKGSPAEKAGIQPGDVVVKADNVEHPTWEDLTLKMMLATKDPLTLTVLRNGNVFTTTLKPEFRGHNEPPRHGLVPKQQIIVTFIEPDMPLYKAGVRVNDEILSINGQHYDSLPRIQALLNENQEKPVNLVVRRGKEQFNVAVKPVPVMADDGSGAKRYRLGFASEPLEAHHLSFAQAFDHSVQENKKLSLLVFELVEKMVQRKVSVKQVEGPVGIARVAGDAARQEGWTPLLHLMSLISLQLGLFNLLPIPILDGGMILFLLIEGTIRRDIDQRIKERIYQTAFVFLVIFAVMVIFNDVSKLV